MTNFEKVGFFMETFGQEVKTKPSLSSEKINSLRLSLINEELDELKKAMSENNILEVTVDFVSEIISCVKDKDNKILSGDPKKIKKVFDTWKFSKDSR